MFKVYQLNFNKEKGLTLDWTFNSEKNCGDFEFSNDDFTCKKKGGFNASTLLGNTLLSEGRHHWILNIDINQGNYLCMGIIQDNVNISHTGNHYSQALCICSDSYFYSLVAIKGGPPSFLANDPLEFLLDFDENFFRITAKDERFIYESKNVKGKKFYPYFGFANNAMYQLTISSMI